MLQKIPNYIKYIFTNLFFLFLYAFIFRLIFYFFFAGIEGATSNQIQKAFLLGIRYDIKLAVLTIFPLSILIFILNQRFFSQKIYKKIGAIYLTICTVIITLFYVTDFGYYAYLNFRLDASSLRFLSNFKISSQVLWESYPIFKGFIGLAILTFIGYKIFRWVYHYFSKNNQAISKKKKVFFIVVPFLLLAFGIYNSFTHYPLRWSQAFFSENSRLNQFSLNPILYFFDSFYFRNEGFNLQKTKDFYPVVAKQLGLPKDSISFERKVTFAKPYAQPNVVIVMLESTGAAPMSYFGNPLNTTPKMDSIIRKSAFFSNFFVHKPGTAATVFASVTGLPDVDDVETASRNPMIINQRLILDQFKGYEKYYFLGGSANWANIRGTFQSNIKNIHIFEEGSYPTEKRTDVWGIDDYALFREADKELAKMYKKKKPFVAYIQTASNHMPFSVPDKKGSYRPLREDEVSKKQLKEAGFDGIKRLNALRYLDFNVDKFLKRAKKSSYYNDTIFLFFGDHDTYMTTTKGLKKEFDFRYQVHHVPFFINAPKYVKPQVISKYTKLIDVVPTAASLAKINYTNYTLGIDALDTTRTNDFAFLYRKIKGEPGIGLLQGKYYYTRTNITHQTSLYVLSDDTPIESKKKYPMVAKKMDSLLQGFYNSTQYLYYNNKKK